MSGREAHGIMPLSNGGLGPSSEAKYRELKRFTNERLSAPTLFKKKKEKKCKK